MTSFRTSCLSIALQSSLNLLAQSRALAPGPVCMETLLGAFGRTKVDSARSHWQKCLLTSLSGSWQYSLFC